MSKKETMHENEKIRSMCLKKLFKMMRMLTEDKDAFSSYSF